MLRSSRSGNLARRLQKFGCLPRSLRPFASLFRHSFPLRFICLNLCPVVIPAREQSLKFDKFHLEIQFDIRDDVFNEKHAFPDHFLNCFRLRRIICL